MTFLKHFFGIRAILLILIFSSAAQGGIPGYPASAIPDSLKKNADVVIRTYEISIEVESPFKIVEKGHIVYTVMRKAGDNKAFLVLFYNNDSKIKNFTAKLYGAEGTVRTKSKSVNIIDRSAVKEGTLYCDDRVEYFDFTPQFYPYTIEYEYERVRKNVININGWHPVNDYGVSLEYGKYSVISSSENLPQLLPVNFPAGALFKDNIFEIGNIPAFVEEPLCPGIEEVAPSVLITPAFIKIGEKETLPISWNSIGLWQNYLSEDRGDLPGNVVEQIRNLTSGITDIREKVKIVYKYIQENTRYESVQIGIGGFQPAEAASVAKYGWGDCKALSNYTKSLLGSIGIESFCALVKAGHNASPIKPVFPGLQFNHMIVCVPVDNDTLWLECTSQTAPFNFPGSFTGNRYVLLLKPEGGVLVKTPSYSKDANRMQRVADIYLDSLGNAKVCSTVKVSGLQYELLSNNLNISSEDQKKNLMENTGFSMVKVSDLTYHNSPGIPELEERSEVIIHSFAGISGKRMFLPLNFLNQIKVVSISDKKRILPFRTCYSYSDSDSIVFHIPGGFKAEIIPEAVEVAGKFGTYNCKTIAVANQLIYTRQNSFNGGYFPPELFDSYTAYIKNISRADKSKAALICEE